MNFYAYAGSNPISYSDPFGLCSPRPWCWAQESAEYWAGRAASSRGVSALGNNLMGGLATLVSDPGRAALTGLTLASGGVAAGLIGRGGAAALGTGAAADASAAGTSELAGTLRQGLEYALDPNKLNHFFGNAEHGLAGLVEQLGSREAVVTEAVKGLVGEGIPAAGRFSVLREIAGQTVRISGAVVDGVAKIGTMYVP